LKGWRPTREQLAAARGKAIESIWAPGLDVVFCGLNPSLYSAAVGHHFARPGNRFWPALHLSGFTDRLLSPFEDVRLVEYGAGVTNIVPQATASAAEIERGAYGRGGRRLVRELERWRPKWVAVLGIGAYEVAFGEKRVKVGPQDRMLAESQVWVLPSPSGLNANHQLGELVRLFGALREAVRG
jgi:double-stranded uracil-DNA glycosylase